MTKLEYRSILPELNLSEKFIVLESACLSFLDDWIAFQDIYLSSFDEKLTDKRLKSIKNYKKGSKVFFELDSYGKEFFGISEVFDLIDVFFTESQYKYVNKMNYKELIEDFYLSNEKIKLRSGYSVAGIIDKFFIYQWSNKKLLFPMGYKSDAITRKKGWDDFIIGENEFINKLRAFILNKTASITATKTRYSLTSYIVTATKWSNCGQITEESLVELRNYITSYFSHNSKKKDSSILCLNEIRYMLNDLGRNDIKHPKEIKKEIKYKTINYMSTNTLFTWLDETKYPNFKVLKKQVLEYANNLKKIDNMYETTIRTHLTSISHLFKYLYKNFLHVTLDEKIVDHMYNIDSSSSLHIFLRTNQKLNDTRYRMVLKDIGRFLEYIGLFTNYAKKNTPKLKSKKLTSPRNAMPREMLIHLIDIVKNRPPKKDIYWNKNKANLDWWRHKDVYPVFPLMALLHYYIPLRGAQIRNFCRDISFKIDPVEQKINTIVVNTDKNVNRGSLQEIPCIWDDLNIFVDFLKWHKEYFPNLPKVKYQNEENTPFPEFTPLMIVDGSNKPMDQKTYFSYHKRILCQYQIEMQEKFEKNEIEVLPNVAWMKKEGKAFFKTVKELDTKSDNFINMNIDIAYDVHSIRVTGITRYLDAGLGLHLITLLSGHTDLNTVIRVYVKLTKEEQMKKLKSSINGLFFGEKETLEQNTKKFVFDELSNNVPNSSNIQYKKEVEKLVSDNGLFSLHRKDEQLNKPHSSFQLGTDIIKKTHPSLWQVHIFGICPSVNCESGRERKCSLCPYLITGKLFLHGIVHQTNLTFARFYRLSKEMQEEKKKGYNSHAKAQELEVIMEEVLGWSEIINRLENDISSGTLPSSNKSIFSYQAQDEVSTYLANAYDAKALGVEQDYFGLKVLTIKAVKLLSQKENTVNLEFLDSEEKTIDFLMNYFKKESKMTLLNEVSQLKIN